MFMKMDPFIDFYNHLSKSNGWLIYTAGRRSSDLGGLQGGYEEKEGEEGLFNNHCKIYILCVKNDIMNE